MVSGNELYSALRRLDERLVSKRFPPLAPWWADTLRDFYQSGKRQLVLRVGRRGGKSSTLCRIAVAEALWGGHEQYLPPGDIGLIAIVSVNRAQAAERIRTISAILAAMGMREGRDYRKTTESIELISKPVKFQTFAATRTASVGFTAFCIICDELALWRAEDTGANPAADILAWLRPTMATVPTARMFLSSSPFSTLDAHHEAFERGNTVEQVVASAPTWIANPTLTEQQTRALEPDELEWTRQFKAEPVSAGTVFFFDTKAIDDAIDPEQCLPFYPQPGDIVGAGGDFGFRSDSSALVLSITRGDIRRVGSVVELVPSPTEPLLPSRVVASFAQELKTFGCPFLMADGHYRMAIAEHLEEHGLEFVLAPEGQRGIAETFVRARVLLHNRQLLLPNHKRLIAQLKEVTSAPTAGGTISIKQKRKAGGGHGDLVSALVLAIWQRDGATRVEIPAPKFGTPEYWTHVKSADYINGEAQKVMEREELEMESEDRPWWDRHT